LDGLSWLAASSFTIILVALILTFSFSVTNVSVTIAVTCDSKRLYTTEKEVATFAPFLPLPISGHFEALNKHWDSEVIGLITVKCSE